MSTVTISSITKDMNSFLSSMESLTDEQKKRQEKAVEYIIQLAALTNSNISRWNIVSVFGIGQGNILVDIKSDINKKFFERLSKKIDENPDTDEALEQIEKNEALIQTINNVSERLASQRKTHILNNLTSTARHLSDYLETYNSYLVKLNTYRQELNALEGVSESEVMKKELAEIIANKMWVNPVYEHPYLYLNTKNNVVITYKNSSASIDLELDLGQLAVKINVENFGQMTVIPYKNNIKHKDSMLEGGYYHPHVYYDGGICWGDARNSVTEWMKEGKLAKTLKMLYSLLFNYNDSSPYIHIRALKENSVKYSPTPERLMHPDKRKKPKGATKIETEESTMPTPGVVPPVFNIGTRVECEESARVAGEPRYNYERDTGGSGRWITGQVTEIRGSSEVEVLFDNGRRWGWPLEGSSRYHPDQWIQPGYIRIATAPSF